MPVPINAHHDHIVSNAAAQVMGKTGRFYIADASAGSETLNAETVTGTTGARFCALQVINDAVFASLTFSYIQDSTGLFQITETDDASADLLNSITVPAGIYIPCVLSEFVIESGVVFAYIG